jgi:MFS family permease
MVGIGETYLPAFVLALSGNQLASGLIATLPMLAGGLLQLAAPLVVHRWATYRRWVVFCAALQAAVFVPLVAAAWCGRMPLALVFAAAAMYWATGMGGGPAWNAWVERLVPPRIRARFFARRAGVAQVGLLFGFVAGGALLQASAGLAAPVQMFAVLFLAAGLSRAVSTVYLSTQSEPALPPEELRTQDCRSVFWSLRHEVDQRVLLCILGTHLTVWIAAPYFTPYMLAHLHTSYAQFVALICAAYVSKLIVLPALGSLCDRWGARRILWGSGLAIAPIPALWLVSQDFLFLLGLQVIAGAAWGAFELAMLLLFFQTIPHDRRLGILTAYNVAQAAAITVGSAIGGLLLAAFGSHPTAYLLVFAVSALARGAIWLLSVPLPQRVWGWRRAIGPAPIPRPIAVERPQPASVTRTAQGVGPALVRRGMLDAAREALADAGQAAATPAQSA